MVFQIQKCKPENRKGKKPCYSDDKINEFIRHIQVDQYILEQGMSFVNFDDMKPIYVKLDMVSSTLLDVNYTN